MKNRSFFIRIWGAFVAVLVFAGLLAALVTALAIRSHHREEVADRLEMAARILGNEAAAVMAREGESGLLPWAVERGRLLGLRVTLVAADTAGRVLCDSAADPAAMEGHAQRVEVAEALEKGYGRSLRFSETTRVDRMYVALPWPDREHAKFVVRTSGELAALDALAAPFLWSFLGTGGIALVFSLGASFLVTRRMTRPLQEFTRAARSLAAGNFATRVHPPPVGEFADLAGAFNRMAKEVQRLFRELRQRNEEWTVTVSAIREGLALIDRDFAVVRANKAFADLAGTPDVTGKPYWELVRAHRFGGLLAKVRDSGQPATEMIDFHDRAYLCSLSPICDGDMIAAVFFDITEVQRLEAVKRDLVMNFSHEFKTPLAAIQGYAEAMENDDVPNREYAAIIRRNAERLARITDDLLLLADLERRDRQIQREDISLADLTRQVEELFRPLLREKGLSLALDIPGGFPPIPGDRFLLEQVFTNLVSNALRHTERGGVTIRAARIARRAVVEVSDTGEGIPAEHLERIFERFYVVDRSRSRRRDGTGLGLSIVRNIVLKHGGDIAVVSRPGEGTTFSLRFPLPGQEDYSDES